MRVRVNRSGVQHIPSLGTRYQHPEHGNAFCHHPPMFSSGSDSASNAPVIEDTNNEEPKPRRARSLNRRVGQRIVVL